MEENKQKLASPRKQHQLSSFHSSYPRSYATRKKESPCCKMLNMLDRRAAPACALTPLSHTCKHLRRQARVSIVLSGIMLEKNRPSLAYQDALHQVGSVFFCRLYFERTFSSLMLMPFLTEVACRKSLQGVSFLLAYISQEQRCLNWQVHCM